MAPLIVEIHGGSSVLALREEGMKHALRSTAEACASEGSGFAERAVWWDHERRIHSRDSPEGPGHVEEDQVRVVTFSLYAGRWQGDLVRPLLLGNQATLSSSWCAAVETQAQDTPVKGTLHVSVGRRSRDWPKLGTGSKAFESLRSHPRQSVSSSEKMRHLGTKRRDIQRAKHMRGAPGGSSGHDAGMLLTCTSLRLKAAIRKKISVPALAREQEEKGPGMVPAPKLQGPQPNVRVYMSMLAKRRGV